MPRPIVYEVHPSSSGWVVRIASDSLSELYDDKDIAVARAHQLAAQQDAAVVRVLTSSGAVEAEYGPTHRGG